jgi:hypothetical protein
VSGEAAMNIDLSLPSTGGSPTSNLDQSGSCTDLERQNDSS